MPVYVCLKPDSACHNTAMTAFVVLQIKITAVITDEDNRQIHNLLSDWQLVSFTRKLAYQLAVGVFTGLSYVQPARNAM